jgi:uncharacterized Zn-finger protein
MSTANDSARVEVTASELPIHCPMPDAPLWNSHPRVYIPLEDSPDGVATCSYCGTEFVLATKQAAAAD